MTDTGEANDQLVADWWEYWRLARGTRDERKALSLGTPPEAAAAPDRLRDLVDQGGQVALDVVFALVNSASDDADLALVGAGPLEDLLQLHGRDLAGQIDRLSVISPRFKSAMNSVY